MQSILYPKASIVHILQAAYKSSTYSCYSLEKLMFKINSQAPNIPAPIPEPYFPQTKYAQKINAAILW